MVPQTFSKERIEVFTDGKIPQLENFRKLKGYGWQGFKKLNLWSQDKRQQACPEVFMGVSEPESHPFTLMRYLNLL